MNTAWLTALGLALVLVVGVVVLLLRRGRRATPPLRPPIEWAESTSAPVPLDIPPAAEAAPTSSIAEAAAEIEARRQAATEALRLARQRKAEEEARLEAERADQARRAETEARSTTRPAPLTEPPPGATPRAQVGWSSRSMGLGPPEPIAPLAKATPDLAPWPAPEPEPEAAPALELAPEPEPVLELVPQPALELAPEPEAEPEAEPEPGRSPDFELELILVPPHPQLALEPHQPLPVQPPALPQPPAAPRVPVVLVADDSKVVRVKLSRLLERQGWHVLLAENGAAALQLLDSKAPDLLITDVEMPVVDGFALTRQVRGHARCAGLPVIMITSSDERHRDDAQAAGVDLLLGKPYEEDALLAQAQRLLGIAAPALH